jgi:hypothetical protein
MSRAADLPGPLQPEGSSTHPMNGAAVYTIIGVDSWSRANMSPTVPPATERNALPATPPKKRAINNVPMFLASAHGMIHTMNMT